MRVKYNSTQKNDRPHFKTTFFKTIISPSHPNFSFSEAKLQLEHPNMHEVTVVLNLVFSINGKALLGHCGSNTYNLTWYRGI